MNPQPGSRDRYLALFSETRPTERLQFFSDAVFAIAMTLLVLDIRLPDVERDQVGSALNDLRPEFFAYALSFVVIAVSWIGHHRWYQIIDRVDSVLIKLNLALLFVIAFLPFPTSVLSEYGSTAPAAILYAATVGALGVIELVTWIYTCRKGLLSVPIDRGAYRYGILSAAVNPLVFGLSIIIALLGWPTIALFSWLLAIPLTRLVRHVRINRADDLEPLRQA